MRVNEGYIFRKIGAQPVLVPADAEQALSAVVYLNETAEEIYQLLTEQKTPEQIASILLEEYDAPENRIREDLNETLECFRSCKVIMED